MPKGGRLVTNDEGDISLLSNASLDKMVKEYSTVLNQMKQATTDAMGKLSSEAQQKIKEMQANGLDVLHMSETQLRTHLQNTAEFQEESFKSYAEALKAQAGVEKQLNLNRAEENKRYFEAGQKALQSYLKTSTSLERQKLLGELKDEKESYLDKQKLLTEQLKYQQEATLKNIDETNNKITDLDNIARTRQLTAEEIAMREENVLHKQQLEERLAAEKQAQQDAADNAKRAQEDINKIAEQQWISPEKRYNQAIEKLKELKEERESLLGEQEILKKKEIQLKRAKDEAQNKGEDVSSIEDELTELSSSLEKNSEALDRVDEDQQAAQNNLDAATPDKLKGDWKKEIKEHLGRAIGEAIANIGRQVDSKISTFYEYQAKMNARLQGTDKTWGESLKTIARNIALSPYVKQTDVVNKMKDLIESGIAYDVELRAFLGTISEDIASTFDVMQSSLTRMIRIQQSDSTAMRLGMEAYLTKFYNGLFSDTSYLTDEFDSVTDAIFEASARLEKAQSVEFEYAVQKWLGSLYSLGLSQQTVTQIASGLNYLGTGDVEALNGNPQLTTLFGMAASQAEGLSYSDLITNGLDASNTNKLMESMVRYLRDIAQQTRGNNVVAKSYSNILGLTMSDLTVLSKLDNSTLNNITTSMLTYADTLSELVDQSSQISKRVHTSVMFKNLSDNALTTAALDIGDSKIKYPMWLATNIFKDVTGGISVPFLEAAGFGLDIKTTIADLILAGMAGTSLLSSLLKGVFSGISPFGTFDLDKWGYRENTVRGEGAPKIGRSGVSSGFSQSSVASTGSGSAEDIESSSLSSGAEEGNKKAKTVNAESGNEAEKTVVDVYKALFEEKLPFGLEEQILESSENILDLLSDKGIKTNIVKSIRLPTDATVINTPVVILGGMGGGSNVSTSTINGSTSVSAASSISSIVSTVDGSMNSLQTVESVIDKYNSEGESSLNVNVMNMPEVELGNIGEDAKQFMTDFTNKILMNAIALAIRSSISQTTPEGEPIDIVSVLTDLKELSRTQNIDISDIANSVKAISYKTNI